MDKIFNVGGGGRKKHWRGKGEVGPNPPLSSKGEKVEGGKKNGLIFVVVKKRRSRLTFIHWVFPSPIPAAISKLPATFS